MNPGELSERITILEIIQSDNTYTWGTLSKIWGKAELQTRMNLFSKVGQGVRSIKFTVRHINSLTLHNAFKWRDCHCFLTDINKIDRAYYEVTAALIEPQTCVISRTGEATRSVLNRPVYGDATIITFPGCLTEKYMGYTQNQPMATKEIRYVLVTPKAIVLNYGELVTINDITYNVLIAHTLDNYKNEYEILVKGDI